MNKKRRTKGVRRVKERFKNILEDDKRLDNIQKELILITIAFAMILGVLSMPPYIGFSVMNQTNETSVLDMLINETDYDVDIIAPEPGLDETETDDGTEETSTNGSLTNTTEPDRTTNETEEQGINQTFETNQTGINRTQTNTTENNTESITTNVSTNITTNISINLTENFTDNLTTNPSTNISANTTINVTENTTKNITKNVSLNITPSILESTTQGKARVGEPVKWTRVVETASAGLTDIEQELHPEAERIKLFRIQKNGTEELMPPQEGKTKYPSMMRFQVQEGISKYKITYQTPGPEKREENISGGKRIIISSEVHYEEIEAYTEIKPSPKEAITLYRIKDGERELVEELGYTDYEDDKLIDKIRWTVPHLSEEIYEVEISVLNVHSRPRLGENWTVSFNTTGTAKLRITPIEGTTWEKDGSGEEDLEILELKCGEEHVGYGWENKSITVEQYTCEETGTITTKELTGGKHVLLFEFGGKNATAENFVARLQCDLTTSCGYTDVFHIAEIANTHAELNNQSGYPLIVCCKEENRETLGTDCTDAKNESILKLSSQTNAHVQKSSVDTYPFEVCMSPSSNYNITCSYVDTEDCQASGFDTCLASISSLESGTDSNLHVAGCGEESYQTKICCGANMDIVCTDNDGDGYYSQGSPAGCPNPRDCNDADATIIPPHDDLLILEDKTICGGTYQLNDSDGEGILKIGNNDVTLTCAGTVLKGNNSGTGIYTGHGLDQVRGCTLGNYSIGIYAGNLWNDTENPTGQDDHFEAVAIDSEDKVVAAGYTNYQFYVKKYNFDGTEDWTWQHDVAGSATDYLYGAAVDSNDSIIVSGYDLTHYSHIIKLDKSGNVLWNWTGNAGYMYDVETDGFDNIITVGGYDQLEIVKLSPQGTKIWNWTYEPNPVSSSDRLYGAAIDSAGNIIAAGADTEPGAQQFHVIKLNSQGKVLWNWTHDPSTKKDALYGVDTDSNDDIIVAGYDQNVSQYSQLHIVKLNSTGSVMWNWTNNATNASDAFNSVVVDEDDDIFAGGYISPKLYLDGESLVQDEAIYIAKLNSTGSYLKNFSYNPTEDSSDTVEATAKDSNDNIIAGGHIQGTAFYTTRLNNELQQTNGNMTLENNTVENTTYAIRMTGYMENGTVKNNTLAHQDYGMYFSSDTTNTISYYNNISNSTKYHAYAEASGNHFNTTNGSSCGAQCARGNYWGGIEELDIVDSNTDGFGDYGSDYPYNSTNEGNVSSFVEDEGPITTRECRDQDGDGFNESGIGSDDKCGSVRDCNDNNASILPPYNGLNVTTNVILCPGTFVIKPTDANDIIMTIGTDDVILTGNGTRIIGNDRENGTVIDLNGKDRLQIQDIEMDTYRIILDEKSPGTYNSTFKNLTSNNSYGGFISLESGSGNNSFEDIKINNTNNPFYMTSGKDNNFTNIEVCADRYGAYGLYLVGDGVERNNFRHFKIYSENNYKFTDGLHVDSADENEFYNITINQTDYPIYLYNSAQDNNFTLFDISETSWGIRFSISGSMDRNWFEDFNIFSADNYGIYLRSAKNNTFENITVDGDNKDTDYAIYIQDANNNTIRNSTFRDSLRGAYLATGQDNYLYYNNFSNHFAYHALASIEGNHFNTTVNGEAAGNWWDDLDVLKIYDTNKDGFGDMGLDYPYNNTNGGNVTGYVTDHGPITDRDGRIEAPEQTAPPDTELITDSRNPLYSWNNPEHTISDTVVYDLVVDNDSDWSSPELDIVGISEDADGETEYWNSSWLELTETYYWRVRANDTYNLSEWSTTRTFTILPTVSCLLNPDEVDFGVMNLNDQDNTTDDNPIPYRIENTGNLQSNVTIWATYLWDSSSIGIPGYKAPVPNKYYQFMIDDYDPSPYLWALDSGWANMTNDSAAPTLAVYGSKWQNTSDKYEIEIQLRVPGDEPPGYKSSTMNVTCYQNETY